MGRGGRSLVFREAPQIQLSLIPLSVTKKKQKQYKRYKIGDRNDIASRHNLAATHLNMSNRQMCGCTGFKSGTYHKSYYKRPFKNDTGL